MASWKPFGLLVCVIVVLQLAVAEVDLCHWNGERFEKRTVTTSEIAAEMCGGSILPWTRRGCVDYNGNCDEVSYVRELCLAQGIPGHYACQENQLVCVPGPAPCEDDSSCNDHNACTTDTCTSPNCLHTNVVCPGVDQCHAVAACDPLTGCPAPTVTEGATCDDGDACTENDQCQSDGTCQGTPKTCPMDELVLVDTPADDFGPDWGVQYATSLGTVTSDSWFFFEMSRPGRSVAYCIRDATVLVQGIKDLPNGQYSNTYHYDATYFRSDGVWERSYNVANYATMFNQFGAGSFMPVMGLGVFRLFVRGDNTDVELHDQNEEYYTPDQIVRIRVKATIQDACGFTPTE